MGTEREGGRGGKARGQLTQGASGRARERKCRAGVSSLCVAVEERGEETTHTPFLFALQPPPGAAEAEEEKRREEDGRGVFGWM